MNKILKKLFPRAKIALGYKNNWELAVAVILSAQTTDKKVNEVTEKLFQKYKKIEDYARARQKEFQKDIRKIGLFRNKTKNIISLAKIIQAEYKGKLPKTMVEIVKLPGIGRKSANVILGNGYGVVEGIAVDTHVRRFALRFNLTDSGNPEKIEKDLMAILPKKEWFDFTYRLIEYGRKICPARWHRCGSHPLTKIYPPANKTWLAKN